MTMANGATQENSGGNDNSVISHPPERLGVVERTSRINGIEQNRVNKAGCSGKNPFGKTQHQNDPAGKILERLKLIENEYLSYIKGDLDLLEARLDEGRERQERFKKVIHGLEEEIYNLVSSSEEEEEEEESKDNPS